MSGESLLCFLTPTAGSVGSLFDYTRKLRLEYLPLVFSNSCRLNTVIVRWRWRNERLNYFFSWFLVGDSWFGSIIDDIIVLVSDHVSNNGNSLGVSAVAAAAAIAGTAA